MAMPLFSIAKNGNIWLVFFQTKLSPPIYIARFLYKFIQNTFALNYSYNYFYSWISFWDDNSLNLCLPGKFHIACAWLYLTIIPWNILNLYASRSHRRENIWTILRFIEQNFRCYYLEYKYLKISFDILAKIRLSSLTNYDKVCVILHA